MGIFLFSTCSPTKGLSFSQLLTLSIERKIAWLVDEFTPRCNSSPTRRFNSLYSSVASSERTTFISLPLNFIVLFLGQWHHVALDCRYVSREFLYVHQ